MSQSARRFEKIFISSAGNRVACFLRIYNFTLVEIDFNTKPLEWEKPMPVVLRIKGYRFWFYEADLDEPPHVHVGKNDKEAKYWLTPIVMAKSRKFRNHELSEIEKILFEYQDDILEIWRKEQQKRGSR